MSEPCCTRHKPQRRRARTVWTGERGLLLNPESKIQVQPEGLSSGDAQMMLVSFLHTPPSFQTHPGRLCCTLQNLTR